MFYLPNLTSILKNPVTTFGNGKYMLIEFQTLLLPDNYQNELFALQLKNITPYNNSLNTILKLNPISYEWRKELLPSDYLKIGYRKDGKQIGLIAQEVEEVVPEIVKDVQVTEHQSWKGIDYEKLTTVLIGAVKEQQTQIEELKERISVLESK